MKNILFVSHDANRAGAQILLLRFLRLLKGNQHFQFSILLKEGGIIENEFNEIAKTYLWEKPRSYQHKSFLTKLYKNFTKKDDYQSFLLATLKKQKFDLIVSNTITNGDIMPILAQLNIPILTYVHELEMGIQQYTKPEYFQNVKSLSTAFIACATSVKENLIINHQIDTIHIKVLPSLLPESALNYHVDNKANENLRNQYNIPGDAFLIGGIGTVDLRKGVDIFLQVANKLKQDSSIFFLWVGGQETETEYKNFQIDKSRLELDRVIFQPSVNNPLDFMSIFDVFFVSSREDPYPLVVLEAAMLSKPIICFDKAGGAKDFVELDCGAIIEYLNVDDTVKKIVELKENQVVRENMGICGRKKVLERHNQTVAFQTFVDILDEK
jgi:glycosyltransferase involved in cell wall biosynthesis